MDIYILQVKSVFLLSLWKTYVGPALSVPYGFSYVEMLVFNISAAMVSGAGLAKTVSSSPTSVSAAPGSSSSQSPSPPRRPVL